MSPDLVGILSLLVAFQLYFIALFLLTLKKGNRLSNLILGVFFLLLAINITDVLFQINGVKSFLPLFFLLDDSALLLFGPLLYLYTASVVFEANKLKRKDWLHFIPFLICFMGLMIIYTMAPVGYENSLGMVSTLEVPKGVLVVIGLCYLHGGIYLWLSKRLLHRYDTFIKDRYSNLSQISLGWLNFILNSFIAIWVLGVVQSIIPFTGYKTYLLFALFIFILFLFYFINRVLFQALRKPEIFSKAKFTEKDKYQGSRLSEEKRKSLAQKLVSKMQNEELFLNPNLNIAEVAKVLGVTSKELSQTINQSFKQHFFDFVNSYRVEAAKSLLTKPSNEKLTVQEIMYSVGFSSKSSFNTAFRRLTKITPTQFRAKFMK